MAFHSVENLLLAATAAHAKGGDGQHGDRDLPACGAYDDGSGQCNADHDLGKHIEVFFFEKADPAKDDAQQNDGNVATGFDQNISHGTIRSFSFLV